jgi:hypothetical protein
MGKSTISMAIFNSFLYVYQRVPILEIGFGTLAAGAPWCHVGGTLLHSKQNCSNGGAKGRADTSRCSSRHKVARLHLKQKYHGDPAETRVIGKLPQTACNFPSMVINGLLMGY